MKVEFANGIFELELTREEIVVMISGLGWADGLVPSDEAFTEFVGWPRDRYRALINELSDVCKANPA